MKIFPGSSNYWQERYKNSGNSGAGSYGKLAAFKAKIINEFIARNGVNSVIEWGCGDGNQLSIAKYTSYLGVDVSETALQLCKKKFAGDSSKQFATTDEARKLINKSDFDLALSLDVIFHLVEDGIYNRYMQDLLSSSRRWVIIYSSNDPELVDEASHVMHRQFTKWIENYESNRWKLQKVIKNIYPWNPKNKTNTSFSDFYIFERKCT